jgi:segregation and condensation protein A
MYKVKLEKFEGPLELLLELIEKEKFEITQLSLSKVADQYLEYIKNNSSIQLVNLADFLSVASKLILIKSHALLPMLKFTDEEEKEIVDLERQLEEFKKFKLASVKLGEVAQRRETCYARESFSGMKTFFFPPENINEFDLKKAFSAILSEIPIIEKLQEEVVSDVITLEQKIDELGVVLRERVEASFLEVVAKAKDTVEIIVSFLAMLEMVKQRIIQVEQSELFSDIKLKLEAQ